MAAVAPERIRDDIAGLLHRGLGVHDFSLAAARVVYRAVPFDGVCVLTMDPATLLPTGHVVENGLPDTTLPRYTEIEIREPDFNKFADLARARERAASLSGATGADLEQSMRHRELRRPHGFGDELRAAFVSDSGTWGGLVLLREAGRADFAPADVRLLAALSERLAEGLRRAMLLTSLTADPEEAGDEEAAGLLVLSDDDSIETANAAAQTWLDRLGAGGPALPFVVRTVADRARGVAAGHDDGAPIARARVRTRSGHWLVVRGSMLGAGPDARAVVILEAARSPELAPLIAAAYGLTERERAVTQLVAQGLPTNDIGNRLHLSPYTVQDHLKAIFEKVGVSTRGELVARVFLDHYAARLTR
jgi:DNA-binding NarL/FixJ family response regulator